MSAEEKRNLFFRKALLTVWGLITVVLAFVILLLVNQMIEEGKEPLALSRDEQAARVAAPPVQGEAPRKPVALFFVDEEGRFLQREERPIPIGDYTIENCRAALDALIAGPRETETPILPQATQVRAVYLLAEGELVVDLSRELVQGIPRSASAETLLVQGIAHTLTQAALAGKGDKSARTVRILIEGASANESFNAHIDLSSPLAPDLAWLAAEAPAA